MSFSRHQWTTIALLLLGQAAWADVPPASLSFFGVYGSPVQPLGLASSTADGVGFNILGEWNPSSYASLGLGFEQVTFYNSRNFSIPMLNLEGRVFPFENGKAKFSPYLYGGVGLDLSSTSAVQLKAGIGSRVSIAGPLFFDLAAGSHWIQPPNNLQYVDFRAGLSYSFGFKEAPPNSPTPTITATPMPAPRVMVSVTPTATMTPIETPISLDLESAPVTTLKEVKKYYKLGMKAFMVRNYALSLKLLKKSLASKEIHGAKYYYAETYATIGVIYQFHAHKVKDHLQKALLNYKKALSIDPTTKAAKHYYKKLKAQLARQAKPKPMPLPASGPVSGTDSSPATQISITTN